MDVRADELSPAQKSAIEEILGRAILASETISVRAFNTPAASETRSQALDELRRILEAPRGPGPEVSEEEFETALTEAMRSVRPNYTPIE
jgi:hypothetical protein